MKSDNISRLSFLIDRLRVLESEKRIIGKVCTKKYNYAFGEYNRTTGMVHSAVQVPDDIAQDVADMMMGYLDKQIAELKKEIDSL